MDGKLSIHNRYFYLFLSLILYFVVSPFLVGYEYASYFFAMLFSLVVVLSVYSIEHNKILLWIGIGLGALVFIGHWFVSLIHPGKEYYILDYLVTIIFVGFITVIVLNYVYRETRISIGTLFGAICGYLLIGLAWSFIYLLIFSVNQQSFAFGHAVPTRLTSTHTFIYYSFVTLSTLGYGDITPVNESARALSWLQAITGQIYLTVWIAQLVGMRISQQIKED